MVWINFKYKADLQLGFPIVEYEKEGFVSKFFLKEPSLAPHVCVCIHIHINYTYKYRSIIRPISTHIPQYIPPYPLSHIEPDMNPMSSVFKPCSSKP